MATSVTPRRPSTPINTYSNNAYKAKHTEFFTSPLTNCCAEPGGSELCMKGLFCGCCLYGENVAQLGMRATCGGNSGAACAFWAVMAMCGLCCIPQSITRKDIKHEYGHEDPESNDCLVSTCCSPCALCQEARELEVRRQTSIRVAQSKSPAYTVPPQSQTMPAGRTSSGEAPPVKMASKGSGGAPPVKMASGGSGSMDGKPKVVKMAPGGSGSMDGKPKLVKKQRAKSPGPNTPRPT